MLSAPKTPVYTAQMTLNLVLVLLESFFWISTLKVHQAPSAVHTPSLKMFTGHGFALEVPYGTG